VTNKPKSYWRQIELKYGHLGDRTNCYICGRCFQFLGRHIFVHNITAVEYKDRFGILRKTPLCADDFSNRLAKELVERKESGILKPDLDALKENHWEKGFSFPEAFRLSTSMRFKGKRMSEEQKLKLSQAQSAFQKRKRLAV